MINLINRPRRLRRHPAIRSMVQENHILPANLILPLFLIPGEKQRKPVVSMPGVFQLSIDEAIKEGHKALDLGLGGVILFGIPEEKDPAGSEAYDAN
ncbi:MAG: porphobilinogen synthase, partial [Magnetococcales bacterium]|nr:porphobilinogen synthase [Magnetococcales bacterium]